MKLEKKIGELLRERGQTLSVAESCTGGLLSHRITNVSGSSDYFQGGIVSYSIEAKARHLRIPIYFIKRYGAVSSQVARKMAEGVRKAFQTTYGLSTTGVAGPTGGTKRTPVGTVFIGFSDGKETLAKKENFRGSRREIKEQAVKSSLQFLHEQLVLRNAECGVRNAEEINRLVASRESRIFLIRKAPQGISGRKGRLGIFPASFNPPTMAHRALIREARKAGRSGGDPRSPGRRSNGQADERCEIRGSPANGENGFPRRSKDLHWPLKPWTLYWEAEAIAGVIPLSYGIHFYCWF